MEGRSSRLQRLKFKNSIRTDTSIANYVIPWIPHLKEITIKKRVLTAIANALVSQCQKLEVFRQKDDTIPVNCYQSALEQRNFLLVILQGCPKLRVFDAIHHRIDAKQLTEKPFAYEGLETFRCQVVGLERLSKDAASMFGRITEISAAGRDTTGVAETINKMAGRLQEQQIKIFDQFARLTRLTTLDLGYAWRDPL
ncbi:hypothetical protein BGZ96_012739 [Linnemannia gamsii]|uniref:Uncharacterized protein n=1 Tax=Linnemannia gamsii TaxID=64522 RepID=A0ABQ7JPS7_9FUNG|nr:hypothetical protein BGZ96_012739 [Linnemannia gamsii]